MKNRRNTALLICLTLLLSLAAAIGVHAETANKGLVKKDGKTYIYTEKGKQIKNKPVYKLVVDGKEQYYSVNKKGVAKKLTGLKKLAAERLTLLKAGKKKSVKNLKKAFLWSAKLKYRNNTVKKKGSKAAKYYGKYGFENMRGDCNTQAFTFYWMAKVLGYSPKVIQGYVPDGSLSNLRRHAWVIMKIGKKQYYFDPNFNQTFSKSKGKYCGFKFRYGTKGTYRYFGANKKPMG